MSKHICIDKLDASGTCIWWKKLVNSNNSYSRSWIKVSNYLESATWIISYYWTLYVQIFLSYFSIIYNLLCSPSILHRFNSNWFNFVRICWSSMNMSKPILIYFSIFALLIEVIPNCSWNNTVSQFIRLLHPSMTYTAGVCAN